MMEDIEYKTKDHEIRELDPYATAKYKITLKWLAPYIGTNKQLLNIGSGTGEFDKLALDKGFKVIACEPEALAYKKCIENRNQTEKKYEQYEIINKGLFELEPSKYQSDIIVMHDVLEHIENDKAALSHIRKLIKKTGCVVISVPALEFLYGFHDEKLGHYRRYNKKNLKQIIEKEFRIVRMRYYGFSFIPIAFLYSKTIKRVYPVMQIKRNTLKKRIITSLCEIESYINPPLGTSLLTQLIPT